MEEEKVSESSAISYLAGIRAASIGAILDYHDGLILKNQENFPQWKKVEPDRLIKTFLDINVPGISGKEDNIRLKLIRFIRDHFSAVHIFKDDYGNLLAEINGLNKCAQPLICTTHLDVVAALGTPQFYENRETGTLLLGIKERETPGYILGADSRAGVAAVLEVMQYFQQHKELFSKIILLFTVEEETGFYGAKNCRYLQEHAQENPLILSLDVPVPVHRKPPDDLKNPPFGGGDSSGSSFPSGYFVGYHIKNTIEQTRILSRLEAAAKELAILLVLDDAYGPNPHVGGDASIFNRVFGYNVLDFCFGTRYQHTPHEMLNLTEFVRQTELLLSFMEKYFDL
jgi:putative aminopeptidase FrvX